MDSIRTMAELTYPAKTKFLPPNKSSQYLCNSFSYYSVQQPDSGSERVIHIMDDSIYAEENNGKSVEDCSLASV